LTCCYASLSTWTTYERFALTLHRRIACLETDFGRSDLPDPPRCGGISREFGVWERLQYCRHISEHPQATEVEATRARLMVELIVSKSVIHGMTRGDVYRRQIDWCQDQLLRNGPSAHYTRQIDELETAIAAGGDAPL
jgi:hypothetical protein